MKAVAVDAAGRCEPQLPQGLATAALEASGSVVLVTDRTGKIVWVNSAFTRVTGWSKEEAIGENPRILQSGLHDRFYYQTLWQAIAAGERFQSTVINRSRDGALYIVAQTVTPFPPGTKHPTHFVAFQEDVSAEIEHKRELEVLAYSDALTGLGNRRALMTKLDVLTRDQRNAALFLLDVDDFKGVNDRYGHAQGDLALCHVANSIRRAVPTADAYRLGGDEFVMLIAGEEPLDPGALRAHAQAMRDEVGSRVGGIEMPRLSISVGAAVTPRDGCESGSLLRAADLALGVAKSSGKGIQTYEPKLGQAALRELTLRQDLKHAVGRGEIDVVFQPIRDLKSKRLVSFEALARWQHPHYGPINPTEFIRIAEGNGAISVIGEFVLRTALAASTESCRGSEIRLAVNVSPSQLSDRLFPTRVARLLAMTGMPARLVDLEFTESGTLADPAARRAIQDLHSLGVGLVVDDFGAGFSQFSYLADFPMTALKLDGALVNNLERSDRHRSLVKGIVTVAHEMGVRVIGECIETNAQLDQLLEIGCDEGQGFYLGRPAHLPVTEKDLMVA